MEINQLRDEVAALKSALLLLLKELRAGSADSSAITWMAERDVIAKMDARDVSANG